MRIAAIFAMSIAAAFSASALDDQRNAGNAVYFEAVFPAFETETECLDALKADPEGRDANLKAGNYYWMRGTAESAPAAAKRQSCKKAVEILEGLWKKNKRDDAVCLCLGYAYMGLAGATPMSELEALLSGINKAQNLFAMVVARLPRNIDARLARTLINMNLTPQNGRPDALVIEDAEVFFAGYSGMAKELRDQAYFYMSAMEMRLALALVYHDQGKKAQARALVAQIDEAVLAKQFKTLLGPLKKAYGF